MEKNIFLSWERKQNQHSPARLRLMREWNENYIIQKAENRQFLRSPDNQRGGIENRIKLEARQ